jgi:hypothetical protein
MKIFISHYHVEKHLAVAVKQQLTNLFAKLVDVFIADDIPFGSNWLNQVSTKLADTDTILVLFSPDSVNRPWINIEAGFGVMTGKFLIPICHSGLDKKDLPVIYSLQQSVELCKHADIERLLLQIAERTVAGKYLGDLSAGVNNWVSAMKEALMASPPSRRQLDSTPCVWVVGSNRDLPESQAAKNQRFVSLFAHALIERKFRVVFGRSGLLDCMANSLGRELDSYDYEVLSEFGSVSAMHRESQEPAPNPVIVLGSIRAQKGPRRVFTDTIGFPPDVMVVIGGSPNGRISNEVELAISSNIPVIPLRFTGGQAARSATFVHESLTEQVGKIQDAQRDFGVNASKLCDVILELTKISRPNNS